MEVRRFSDALGRRVLIIGDTGTGKTRLTAELLSEAVRLGYARSTTAIDLAPNIILPSQNVVGSELTAYIEDLGEVHYLRPRRVRAPRLEAKIAEEVLRLAEENAKAISVAFDEYLKHPTEILFLNDASLYLHAGELEKLLSVLSKSKTCVLNGYYGTSLEENHDSGVSIRERMLMNELARSMDLVIKLNRANLGEALW